MIALLLWAWLAVSTLAISIPPAADDPAAALAAQISTPKIAAFHQQMTAKPHLAGTPTGRAQADLIAQTLRGFGLKVETHSYWAWLSYPRRMSVRWFRPNQPKLGISLALNERTDTRDPATAELGLPPGFIAFSSSGRVRGPMVYAGHGLPEDLDALARGNVAVKGAIALVRHGKSPLAEKVAELEKRGFAGIVLFSDPPQTGPKALIWPLGPGRAGWFVERGAASRTPAAPTIPVATIAWAVAEPIFSASSKPPRSRSALPATPVLLPGELEMDIQMNDGPKPVFNVIATVAGSEQPERWVILGAHHDAWGFGGVDPGASVAALLELARVLGAMSKSGWRPRHSIQIAFWDGGEYGNAGAAEHAKEFLAELNQKLGAYLNCDSVLDGRALLAGTFPPTSDHRMDFGAYHSVYDTTAYMTRWQDPGFRNTRLLAERLGREALRLASEDLPARAKPAEIVTANEPARGEVEFLENRVKQAREAFQAGAITKAMLDTIENNLTEARSRYERLRAGSGQLTPAIAAEEVQRAEQRAKEARAALERLAGLQSSGMIARLDLERATETVKEANEYLDLTRIREQELANEWELVRRVKEWEARGGQFDERMLERLSTDFEQQFGKPLPVSAMGMTHTHELLNFDHSGRVDVALHPESTEGSWLIAQLTLRDVPFLIFRSAVPGKATGAHIHLGLPSPRLRQ